MANPVYNKIKGKDFEREIVSLMKQFKLDAHRTYGSTGTSEGREADVDVVIKTPRGDLQYQCERVKKLRAKYQLKPHLDGVIFRQDHADPMILVRLDLYLALFKSVQAITDAGFTFISSEGKPS